MIRLAVCDDDPFFLEECKKLAYSILSEAGLEFRISEFTTAEGLMQALRRTIDRFDVLLLDILLDKANGIEIARTLRGLGFSGGIIFITSSRDFLLEGYSVYPIQYLIKPIQKEALKEALSIGLSARKQPLQISFPVRGGHEVIPVDRILYVESQARAIMVYLKDRAFTSLLPLKETAARLPTGLFVQCHRSFIVSMNHIGRFTRYEIFLKNGHSIPIGRIYHEAVMSSFIRYMEMQ